MHKHASIAVILSAALMAASPVALMADTAKTQQSQPAPKADAYEVRPIASLPIDLAYPARLQSIRSATVVSRVTGELRSMHYNEGEPVEQGALLYRIEPDVYAAAVHEAEADVALAEATLTNAERDWERAKALHADRAISQKAYDAARAAYAVAKAEVGAANARLATAQVAMTYTEVKAPIAGIAGMKQTDLGNVVSEGTPLVAITQLDPIYAAFSIPDVDWLKAKAAMRSGEWGTGQDHKLQVTLKLGRLTQRGEVDYIAPVVDEATSSVKVRARFDNPDGALMPGAFGHVTLDGLKRRNVVMIPQKAVLQTPNGTIVFLEQNGVAAPRPIVLGDAQGQSFIVESGLQSGDRVIVNNFFRVKPGQPVQIDTMVDVQGN